jgi:hypothetical protein
MGFRESRTANNRLINSQSLLACLAAIQQRFGNSLLRSAPGGGRKAMVNLPIFKKPLREV